jgi:hypothetical protein
MRTAPGIRLSAASPAGEVARTIPNPIFVALAVLGLEFARVSAWRARRYGITDRRVLVLDRKGNVTGELHRRHVRRVAREGPDLLIEGPASELRLAGLADPESVRGILGVGGESP